MNIDSLQDNNLSAPMNSSFGDSKVINLIPQPYQTILNLADQGTLPIIDLFNAAQQLTQEGRSDAAILLYQIWIRKTLTPLAYAAYFNLGVIFSSSHDPARAESAYRSALELKPDFIEAHLNLGTLQENQGHPLDALASWQRVVDIVDPSDLNDLPFLTQALNNLGRLLEILRRYPEAEAMLLRSIRINPKQPNAITHWVHLRQKQCKWPIYVDIEGVTTEEMVLATSALAMLSASGNPAEQLAASRRYVDKHVLKDLTAMAERRSYGHKRLRIGYLSSDFCSHAVSILIVELLELHDRNKVEVFGFCWSREDGTPMRARIVKAMDHHIRIGGMTDEEAARCIRDYEIDILIDLHGLTLGMRTNILSHRPAPLQMTYLGFPGSTALPSIDYVICDSFVLPPELTPFFTEKPLYLPNTFQVNDRKRVIGPKPSRAECGLPEDGFIYCSFNNNHKFTPELFDCWMRILQRTPNSILWLIADSLEIRETLRLEAEFRGVARERLFFADRVGPDAYLARYQVADLFLDTLPFNGGTTASDSLWAGLPVLTCVGQPFASRMAGSLLKAAELPELICFNLEHYESKAIELGNAPEQVIAFKARLKDRRLHCALFDSARLTRDLEDLFIRVVNTDLHPPYKSQIMNVAKNVEASLPLVSVLIPTHNRPDYLELALNSVLNQSYQNIEIVISDNGDDDLSQQRLLPYLDRYPNIKYFKKQGLTAKQNFRKCFEIATGEYINYLMDDDLFHPDKIQRMMHYYLNYPNIGLVTSFRQLIDEHGNEIPSIPGTERMFPIDTVVTGQSFGNLMLTNGTNLIGEPTTVLVRKSDVGDAFGTFAGRQYTVLSDIATWLSILATRDCIYISDALSYFRMHGGQDQKDNSMRVRASMEWFGLLIDSHKQKLFLQDGVDFSQILAVKIGGFATHIALNHNDMQAAKYDQREICQVIHVGYQ
ncbi:MAG: glycosyltransferase, partial [Rhodoferax sp.]|nr:glycosyltransferase [Rhodoferax sp.]